MKNFHAGWYLIYTKPRHERKVHNRLKEVNVRSFLPLTKKLRTWHDRRKYVDEPLFPSYVFIYLSDLQNYYEGIDTEGALYYVRTGKEIAMVPQVVIDNIKLVSSHADDIEVSDSQFAIGRKLVVSKGALTGLSCEVVEADNKQKVLVRVDLLKRNILISMPQENLMAI